MPKRHKREKLAKTGRPTDQVELDREAAGKSPLPGAVDRPGLDLGGSTGKTTAGTGLGLGNDAVQSPQDRSLPGRRGRSRLTIPRWSGPSLAKDPLPPKKKPL